MTKKLLLESKTCGRCAGSGRYGPSCVYGGVCFKCNGNGAVLTKRGRAAQNFLNDLRMRKMSEFKVGDLILSEGFSAGSYNQPSFFARITEIVVEGDAIKIEAKHNQLGIARFEGNADSTYRKGFTNAEKVEQCKEALAYQETLTKAGTVAKRKVKLKEAA